jgi:tRNA(Ile)-lysidine synthase
MLDRWPSAATSVSRSARLIGESAELLDELARVDLGEAAGTNQIPVEQLTSLPSIRQKNSVRYAIRAYGLATPTERQLNEALEGLLASRPDSQPVASWPGVRIRRFRGVLWMYAEHDDPLEAVAHAPCSMNWQNPAQPLQLGKVRGVLELQDKPGEGFSTRLTEASLEIRFREGGERLRPSSGGSERTLKNLLQESDVLPWMRGNIPLLYSSGQLLAVGDIWINAEFAAQPDEAGRVLLWHDHAPVFHESALSGSGLSGKL